MDISNVKALKALNSADWDDIAPKLLRFIIFYMREKSIKNLPDAMTAQELANDIVRRVYLGAYTNGKEGRSWNPEKHPHLLTHLKWIAKSDLSGKGLLGKKRDKDLVYKETERELDELSTPIHCDLYEDVDDDSFSKALKAEIKGDADLENIVAAIELGFLKSGDIAKETGIHPDKIYELRRKLERKAEKARKQP